MDRFSRKRPGRSRSSIPVALAALGAIPLVLIALNGSAQDALPVPEVRPEPRQIEAPSFRQQQFRRGDTNADGTVDITDAVTGLEFLFKKGEPPPCMEAGNSNGDGQIDVSDAVFTLSYLFAGTRAPPAPGPDECGVDPRESTLGCDEYALCSDELALITHVLGRITFGANVDLLSRIQTRRDLIDYIEEQLAAPSPYDQATHEPELDREIEALDIGFKGDRPLTANNQVQRVKGMLLTVAIESEWQLLHVVAQFWNNHFHTQIDTLPQSFFGRGGRGGGGLRSSRELFNLFDTDGNGILSESEWNAVKAAHPSAIRWEDFGRGRLDGITAEEFLNRNQIAYWKYRARREQLGVAADMERREYDFYRRSAFGKFRDLIEGCSKSVAMLIYLNGFENTVREPNENFAREYFELFALGVDRVYTQRDIEELSKVFTGWTVGWVRRSLYAADDINFQDHPEARHFLINRREPAPLRFPDTSNWDDSVYTWAFVLSHLDRNGNRTDQHDWSRKDLFLRRFGGVDSLGNPADSSDQLTIPAVTTTSQQTRQAALREFDLVTDRVVNFRDCAKFISTKLIQLFVTDDLSLLKKTYPMPAELRARFDSVDRDRNGIISGAEWSAPVPLVLPNGRPPEIFDELDADGNGVITEREYQEPDLLLDAIAAWRDSDGTIRDVLRAILLSDEFLSLKFRRAKVKTPFELVTSSVRALDAAIDTDALLTTTNDLVLAGQELFNFADPTGESELGFDWMHTVGLLERLKYVNRAANPATIAERRVTWNPNGLRSRWNLTTGERTVDFLNLLLHSGDVLPEQRELALEVYGSVSAFRRIPATTAFLLSLPQFQKQ